MKIEVIKLREALELLEPVIPRKTSLLATTYIRLGDKMASATDLTVFASVHLPEAEERMMLPFKRTLEFLKYSPWNKMVIIACSDKTVSLEVGNMRINQETLDPGEFPPLPEDDGTSEGVLDGDALVRTLNSLAPFAAREDSRPVLHTVHLEMGEDLEAAAADGFRLHWVKIPGKISGPSMNIPLNAISVISYLWKKGAVPDLSEAVDIAGVALAKRLIRLNWGTARLKLQFGNISLVIKLVEGTFPNYHQLIPTESGARVTVMAEDLERALHQMSSVASESNGIVRLRWQETDLLVSARADNTETVIPVHATSTEPGKTAVNLNYLREYLKDRPGLVTLSTPKPQAPILLTHQGLANTVLMPMFVKWDSEPSGDDKAPAEATEKVEASAEPKTESKPKSRSRRK